MIIIQNFKLCEEIKLIKENFQNITIKQRLTILTQQRKTRANEQTNKGERTEKQGRTNRQTRHDNDTKHIVTGITNIEQYVTEKRKNRRSLGYCIASIQCPNNSLPTTQNTDQRTMTTNNTTQYRQIKADQNGRNGEEQ